MPNPSDGIADWTGECNTSGDVYQSISGTASVATFINAHKLSCCFVVIISLPAKVMFWCLPQWCFVACHSDILLLATVIFRCLLQWDFVACYSDSQNCTEPFVFECSQADDPLVHMGNKTSSHFVLSISITTYPRFTTIPLQDSSNHHLPAISPRYPLPLPTTRQFPYKTVQTISTPNTTLPSRTTPIRCTGGENVRPVQQA